MLRRVLLLFAVACVFAEEPFFGTADQNQSGDIVSTIQLEQALAGRFLDVILRFQHAQSQSYACSMFLQANSDAKSYAPYGSFEEDEDEEDEEETKSSPALFRLQGAYHLLQSLQYKLYQIIINAPEIQQEYYMNRYWQLLLSTQQLPPQLSQWLYLQMFATQLKTLKLSYALQTYSHMRTWLEDEIDVSSVAAVQGLNWQLVLEEQNDDIVMDKIFAFRSYYNLAMIDFQIFMFDFYLKQMVYSIVAQQQQQQPQAAATQASATQASFLEEESSSEFWPLLLGSMFGGFGQNGGMDMYGFWIKYYHLMMQFSAAQAGQYHAQLEQMRLTDAGKSTELAAPSKQAFSTWASSLMQASQMQFMLAMFGMYGLYGAFQQPQPKFSANATK